MMAEKAVKSASSSPSSDREVRPKGCTDDLVAAPPPPTSCFGVAVPKDMHPPTFPLLFDGVEPENRIPCIVHLVLAQPFVKALDALQVLHTFFSQPPAYFRAGPTTFPYALGTITVALLKKSDPVEIIDGMASPQLFVLFEFADTALGSTAAASPLASDGLLPTNTYSSLLEFMSRSEMALYAKLAFVQLVKRKGLLWLVAALKASGSCVVTSVMATIVKYCSGLHNVKLLKDQLPSPNASFATQLHLLDQWHFLESEDSVIQFNRLLALAWYSDDEARACLRRAEEEIIECPYCAHAKPAWAMLTLTCSSSHVTCFDCLQRIKPGYTQKVGMSCPNRCGRVLVVPYVASPVYVACVRAQKSLVARAVSSIEKTPALDVAAGDYVRVACCPPTPSVSLWAWYRVEAVYTDVVFAITKQAFKAHLMRRGDVIVEVRRGLKDYPADFVYSRADLARYLREHTACGASVASASLVLAKETTPRQTHMVGTTKTIKDCLAMHDKGYRIACGGLRSSARRTVCYCCTTTIIDGLALSGTCHTCRHQVCFKCLTGPSSTECHWCASALLPTGSNDSRRMLSSCAAKRRV